MPAGGQVRKDQYRKRGVIRMTGNEANHINMRRKEKGSYANR